MNRDDFLIEADELLSRLADPNLRLFDATIMFYMGMSAEEAAKMPSAYHQYLTGHIPGAAFFDHLEFSDPDSLYEYTVASDDALAEQIGKIGIGNDSQVVVYASGVLACATRAWWLLRYAGVENVRVLNGGLAAWQKAGGDLEAGERHYAPAHFEAQFNRSMFADKEEVQAALAAPGAVVENSLTQEWHDREHIPGSSCLSLLDLMVGWDAFLPQDQLLARLPHADSRTRIITYCGGGIAATANAMAYWMAGNTNVAVYDGSLFEWKGEGLPVAGKGQ